jgi:hypothetical protein
MRVTGASGPVTASVDATTRPFLSLDGPPHIHNMFFCALSGEPPQDAVISAKSGQVYERRLIEKYIAENGTDPVSGEKLEEADLITVKTSACLALHVTPR